MNKLQTVGPECLERLHAILAMKDEQLAKMKEELKILQYEYNELEAQSLQLAELVHTIAADVGLGGCDAL